MLYWNRVVYRQLYICVSDDLQHKKSGTFLGARSFAAYLILALVLHILYESKISIVRVIVITFTIFTTQSSAGIILLIIVVLLLILRNSGEMGKIKQGMIVCLGTGICFWD